MINLIILSLQLRTELLSQNPIKHSNKKIYNSIKSGEERKTIPLLLFKYKDQIEEVILESKLNSTAEVLCKERKVLSIKDCAANKSSLSFLVHRSGSPKKHDGEVCKSILRSAFMANGIDL